MMDLTHPKCDWSDFPDAPDWAVCVINNGAHSAFCEAFDYMARAQWLGGREFRVANPTAFTVIASRNEPGKPEWDGEGLPPVGIEAEVSVDGGRTWCLYKATSERNGMRLVEIGNFTEEFQSNNWTFRPIRSEADKKRAEGVIALSHIDPQVAPFEYGDKHSDGSLIGPFWYELYDAIAAGKIPHIRID
ncbi:hypothetical protein AB3Y72_001515 [Enterobacter roggenkampii]